MKKIFINKGKYSCKDFVLVGDEDYERINQWKWHAFKSTEGATYYAIRRKRIGERRIGKIKTFFMHREILGIPNDIDHKNGDGLDNRKENLRQCNHVQNGCNRGKQLNNKSGYKGVSFYRSRNKWNSQIIHEGKKINIGYFDSPIEAAIAYNDKAVELHKEFAKLNVI